MGCWAQSVSPKQLVLARKCIATAHAYQPVQLVRHRPMPHLVPAAQLTAPVQPAVAAGANMDLVPPRQQPPLLLPAVAALTNNLARPILAVITQPVPMVVILGLTAVPMAATAHHPIPTPGPRTKPVVPAKASSGAPVHRRAVGANQRPVRLAVLLVRAALTKIRKLNVLTVLIMTAMA